MLGEPRANNHFSSGAVVSSRAAAKRGTPNGRRALAGRRRARPGQSHTLGCLVRRIDSRIGRGEPLISPKCWRHLRHSQQAGSRVASACGNRQCRADTLAGRPDVAPRAGELHCSGRRPQNGRNCETVSVHLCAPMCLVGLALRAARLAQKGGQDVGEPANWLAKRCCCCRRLLRRG